MQLALAATVTAIGLIALLQAPVLPVVVGTLAACGVVRWRTRRDR